MDRRQFLSAGLATALTSASAFARAPVRIALLLPLTGEQVALGRMLHDTAQVAIEAINRTAARPIVAEVEDWRSDPRRFDALVRSLGAGQGRPASLFGPCPDTLRPSIGAFLDEVGGLLWDPSGYEGGECSGGILHGGPTPYQSLKQFLPFMAREVGRRFLLIGGERPRARALYRAARWGLGRMGAAVVGEAVSREERLAALRRVRPQKVDVVFCSLDGAELAEALQAFRAAGLSPEQTPMASPTMTELDLAGDPALAAGHVACQPYFAGLRTLGNDRFLATLRGRWGKGFILTAQAEALWGQLHLFAQAVDRLDGLGFHPVMVREAAKSAEVLLPQGRVRLHPGNLHMALWPKIAVAEPDGSFKVIARSDAAVAALPFWATGRAGCLQPEADRPV